MIEFFVPGDPKTAGSKRAFVVTPKGGGKPRAVVTDDAGKAGKDWRDDVRQEAARSMGERPPLDGPVSLVAVFYVRRPQGHLGAGGKLRPSAPRYPTTKPDATKLLRGVEDALSGVVYRDDSQIVAQAVKKRYATDGRVGVYLAFEALDDRRRVSRLLDLAA